jgi:hypothetical protein
VNTSLHYINDLHERDFAESWHKLCPVVAFIFSVNNRKVIRTWYIHVMSLMTCFLTSFYTGNTSTAVTEVSRSSYITRNKNGLNILLDDQRPLPLKVAFNFTFQFRGFWKQNRYLTISYKVFWFLDLDVQNITMFYSVAGLDGWLKNSEYVGSVFYCTLFYDAFYIASIVTSEWR